MVRYEIYVIFYFFYNLLAVDRGCRPLLAIFHHSPHLQSTQLPTNLLAPIITCVFFLFCSGNVFSKLALVVDLLAAGGGLDIRVANDNLLATEIFRVSKAVI